MEDLTGERLRMALITMQECMSMHWENERRKMNGEALTYGENEFYSVINQNHEM